MKVNEDNGHQDTVMYFSTAFDKLDASILGQTMFDSPRQFTSLKPQGIFLSAAMTSAEMVRFSSQPLVAAFVSNYLQIVSQCNLT